jgi:asparagine synthase (glutamine-hydrolysing)
MCGIAGIVAVGGFEPHRLVAMTHLVSYRGPSGFGFAYIQPGTTASVEIVHNEDRARHQATPVIGLGSRRLAILDISQMGTQPMQIADGDLCITFNGEIYNFQEIRRDLEPLGHRFRTGTDTEVILHAYQEWGQECVQRFNGMWSFAIWDRPKQQLFCSRDRFGVKPFYYAMHHGCFYFGSEIKQVLLASNIPRVANPAAVYNFLEFGLIDYSDQTFFEGVQQLPGAHSLTLRLSDRLTPEVRRYWELRVNPECTRKEEDLIEEFRAGFENSVKLRLRSDVPVGFSLSGGIDSSAIICQAAKVAPESRFQSFSACFEEEALDEREYISAVVSAVAASSHRTFPMAGTFWKTIERILFHQDEPLGSTGVFAQWNVMDEAGKNGVPVILGGQGCDESFCGYLKYRYFYLWHMIRHGDPRFIRESVLGLRNSPRAFWAFADVSRYFPHQLRRPFSVVEKLCSPEFRSAPRESSWLLGAGESLGDRQKADLTQTSLPMLLHAEDRNSMAHSVESRLPFMDYRLVELGVNCPAALKMRDGWSKWIVRSALKGILPEKIRMRKSKLGFNTPESLWLRHGLQNGHTNFWQQTRFRMERFLAAEVLHEECRKFVRGDSGAVAANWLFRAIELELWAQVHEVS